MADHDQAAPLSEAAQITIAYLGNPARQVDPDAVGQVIADIYGAVSRAERGEGGVEPDLDTPRPAVPIEDSVTDEHIICLEDGKKLTMLKRYLRSQHNLSPEEYRAKWRLPADYPMVAANYAARRSKLAKAQGLGRKAPPMLPLKSRAKRT